MLYIPLRSSLAFAARGVPAPRQGTGFISAPTFSSSFLLRATLARALTKMPAPIPIRGAQADIAAPRPDPAALGDDLSAQHHGGRSRAHSVRFIARRAVLTPCAVRFLWPTHARARSARGSTALVVVPRLPLRARQPAARDEQLDDAEQRGQRAADTALARPRSRPPRRAQGHVWLHVHALLCPR